MKRRNDYLRTVLYTVLCICILSLTGCGKDDGKIPGVPSQIPLDISATPTAAPTSTPMPSPTPTPIVDVPEGAADMPSRTAEDENPMVITVAAIEGNLNPFYCTSEEDCKIVERTQIKLLSEDESGDIKAGIEYPCLAYSVEKSDDLSAFTDVTENLADNWEAYRITLKEGITFADGTPVTAEDVIFSLYTFVDREYNGNCGVCDVKVMGMDEYHTQISNELRAKAERYSTYGISEEGTAPENVDDIEAWNDVWSHLDEAGVNFAKDIVKVVNEKYGIDAYVQAFLSPNLTYKHIEASESLQVLFAMKVWGYVREFNYYKNTMRDCMDTIHDLNEEELTCELFWELIKGYYGYNLSSADGINYERPYTDRNLESYLAEAYCEANLGVESISGVATGTKSYDDGAVRTTIEVLIDKESSLADFNFYVVQKSFYEGNEHSTDLHGAGEYKLAGTEENVVRLEANDMYMLGGPALKYIEYKIEQASADEETE